MEVAFQDITARECVLAKNTHVWAVSSVCHVAQSLLAIETQNLEVYGTRNTHGAANDASDVWREGRSCYNAGRGISRLHLWLES